MEQKITPKWYAEMDTLTEGIQAKGGRGKSGGP